MVFVKTHDISELNQELIGKQMVLGGWIEDLRKYKNVDEIVEKLALRNSPTKVGLVELPKGVKLRKSVAGSQEWPNGTKPKRGGIQYEIIGERNNNWFSKESLDLEAFFK